MADTAARNFFIYQRYEQFTDRRPYYVPQFDDAISYARHAIFTFILPLLINLLQIKYQGEGRSPFENQPITMLAAITSLLIYCFSYYLMPRNSQHPFPSSSQAFNPLVRTTMVFSCPLTIALFLSVLFSGSITMVLLLSLSIFFSLTQSFAPQMQAILNWVTKAATDIMLKWFDQSQYNRGTRRGLLPV